MKIKAKNKKLLKLFSDARFDLYDKLSLLNNDDDFNISMTRVDQLKCGEIEGQIKDNSGYFHDFKIKLEDDIK
jgi:hypothetical protein